MIRGNDHILRSMVQKLTDLKEIAGHTGEQLPHLLIIIEEKESF